MRERGDPTLFGLSYFFGEAVAEWIRKAEYGITIVVLIAVACGAWFAWRHYRRNQQPSKPGALEKLLGEDESSLRETASGTTVES